MAQGEVLLLSPPSTQEKLNDEACAIEAKYSIKEKETTLINFLKKTRQYKGTNPGKSMKGIRQFERKSVPSEIRGNIIKA